MRITHRLQSTLHHDLPTFLTHLRRTNLDASSTVAVGTRYEYTAQAHLARLGLALRHTGGRSDHGIDLLGTWRVPSRPAQSPLRVLVQCKALQGQTGPVLIRELEGAFTGAPVGYRQEEEGDDVLALLVATKDATLGTREALTRSRLPMGYVHMRLDGGLEQVLWNGRAGEVGLAGLQVGTRFLEREKEEEGMRSEAVLMWDGEVWTGEGEG